MVDKYFFARNHYTAHRAMDKHSKNKAAQKPEYHLPELSVGFGGEMRHNSKIIFQFIKNMSKTDYFDLEPTSDGQILIEEMKKLLQDKITAIQTKNRPTITRAGGEDSIALTQSG